VASVTHSPIALTRYSTPLKASAKSIVVGPEGTRAEFGANCSKLFLLREPLLFNSPAVYSESYVPYETGISALAAVWLANRMPLAPGCGLESLSEWTSGRVRAGDPSKSAPVAGKRLTDTGKHLAAYLTAEHAGRRRVAPFGAPLEARLRSYFLALCRRRPGANGTPPDEGRIWDLLEAACDQAEAGANLHFDGFRPTRGFYNEFRLLQTDRARYLDDLQRSKKIAAYFPGDNGEKAFVTEGLLVESPASVLFTDWAWADLEHSRDHRGFGLVVTHWPGERVLVAVAPWLNADLSSLCAALNTLFGKIWVHAEPVLFDGASTGESCRIADSEFGWWSLRTTPKDSGIPEKGELRKALREALEGGMFENGAKWVDDGSGEHGELHPEPASTGRFPEVKPSAELVFAHVKLRDMSPMLHPAATECVGAALYTLVRAPKDFRDGLPGGFDSEHLQGDSGILTVWTRNGLAVASWRKEGHEIAEQLANKLRQLEALRWAISRFDEGPAAEMLPKEERADQLKRLLRQYTQFQKDLSRSEARLLRRLFDKVSLSEIHRAYLETNHAERAIEHAKEAQDHAKHALGIQQNLEVFELLIICVYAFEFVHQFLEKPVSRLAGSTGPLWASITIEALLPLAVAAAVYTVFRVGKSFLFASEKTPAHTEESPRSDGLKDQLLSRAKWVFIAAVAVSLAFGIGSSLLGPRNDPRTEHPVVGVGRTLGGDGVVSPDRKQFETDVLSHLDEVERSLKAQDRPAPPSQKKTPRKAPPVKAQVTQ